MKIPSYRRYKDSGVAWLGQVPEEWSVKPLKYLASYNDETLPENTDADTTINYVDISSVDLIDGIKQSEELIFEKAPSRARRIVRDGDTIISTVRTYLKAIAAIKKPIGNLIVSTGFAVIRPSKKLQPDFLGYCLQSQGFLGEIVSRSNGVSYPAINPSDLVGLPISVPAIAEQTAIAKFLDEKTAEIDALIAKKEELLKKLAEKRTALITHAITKGLNPSAPMKDSGIGWLGKIPTHWELKKLKYLGNAILGLTYSPDDVVDEGEGALVLRSSNVQGGQIVYNDNVYVSSAIPPELIVKAGDILICSRNGSRELIGKNAIIGAADIGHTFGAFMTIFRSPYSEYIKHVLDSNLFTSQLGRFLTATINQLTISTLNAFEIPLPPKNEQDKITAYLAHHLEILKKAELQACKAIVVLKEYRSAIITNAVTGKIKVI